MPISRYSYTKQGKSKSGERIIESTLYPAIPKTVDDFYVISRPGDRLDLLSQEFYKTPAYWWVIAIANSFVKGSLSIPPNKQVRIPGNIGDIINNLESAQRGR
jgi:nucleoid-associated protein YgaU